MQDQKRTVQPQEQKQLRVHNRCDVIGERVRNKLSRFEQNKDDHVARYKRVRNRLEEIVRDLADKGYDVSKLQEDLATMDTMIREYAQLYVDFIESLENTQEYACGDSEGDFREALARSRTLLRQVRQKRQELRRFYGEEIRQDIKALREQAREMRQRGLSEEEQDG